MKAIHTTTRLFASAGLTGFLFALPMVLAMAWHADLPEPEIEIGVAEPAEAVIVLPPSRTEVQPVAESSSELAAPAGTGVAKRSSLAATSSTRRVATTKRVAAPTPPPPPSSDTLSKAKESRPCMDDNPSIAPMGTAAFAVDRDLVKSYAKKPATLGKLGWASVHQGDDGKADGFKIGGLKCGNDLHQAGFRNGDVVHSVNGKPVTSIPEALWVYATQKGKEDFRIRITRKGKAKTLKYKVS